MSLDRKCLGEKSINRPLLNTPLKGQVSGLATDYPYPPLDRKKWTNREIRDAVDKNDLWFYIPPWQLPRVEFTCLKCRQFSIRNTPMKKIIYMAKNNLAYNGILDSKMSFPEKNLQSTDIFLKKGQKCQCPGGHCGQGCTSGCNKCNCDEESEAILKYGYKVKKISPFMKDPSQILNKEIVPFNFDLFSESVAK